MFLDSANNEFLFVSVLVCCLTLLYIFHFSLVFSNEHINKYTLTVSIWQVIWRRSDNMSPLTLGRVTFTPDRNVDVHMEEMSGRRTEGGETLYNLVIKHVGRKHAGIYMCLIVSTNTFSNNITLNVLGT